MTSAERWPAFDSSHRFIRCMGQHVARYRYEILHCAKCHRPKYDEIHKRTK